jgi:hypothetical protein
MWNETRNLLFYDANMLGSDWKKQKPLVDEA